MIAWRRSWIRRRASRGLLVVVVAEVHIYDPVAGGAALVVIDVGSDVKALAVFKDPATGEPRLACGCRDKKVRIFDPVAGGEALLVIDRWARACMRWRLRGPGDGCAAARLWR